MATLEIHDGRSPVRRVRITRDAPAMFGSDPMCDVRIEGPGIHPFHGRIRWKSSRFKVDASPEVPWIEVNGEQVKSKSLHQGDEVRIGTCRIFLMTTEDGPDHGERTVVQEPPSIQLAPIEAPGPPRSGRPAVDFARMEMAPPSMEGPVVPGPAGPQKPLPRMKARRPGREQAGDEAGDRPDSLLGSLKAYGDRSAEFPAPNGAGSAPASFVERIKAVKGVTYRAPGDDRIFTSPMVIGLLATFLVLSLFSMVLWNTIARATARRQYAVAVEDLESGDFRNAMAGFDRFLAGNPKDEKANKARVYLALARVRQHTGAVGTSWGNALKQERAMVQEVGGLPEYRDSALELDEDVLKTAEGLAERARELTDAKLLAEADSAVALHKRVAGAAAGSLLDRTKVAEKIGKARDAIEKARDLASSLAAMDAAVKARRPAEVYAARAGLVRRYHDLIGQKDVVSRLILANDLIRQEVVFDASGRPGETEPRPEPMGPPTSLVLRLDPGKPPASGPSGPLAYAQVDGMIYGLDAATGAPRWQVVAGPSAPFPPIAIAGDPPTALAFDSRSDELVLLDGRTGALRWRQGVGGPVIAPPLILGNQVLQATPDGRLLQVDLASGDLRGTLALGRKLAASPVADDSAQHLYLAGDEDVLFVLTPDPLGCVAVEYTGQESGTIPCPPARVGRFLILAENRTLDEGRWRVFTLEENGTKLKAVQEILIGGWTRSTPSASGQVIWSASDRGELLAFEIGDYESKEPLTRIYREAPANQVEGPAFPRARTERDFWIASARSARYELDRERGKLAPAWTLGEAGPALAPIQPFDRLAVLTQQYPGGPGYLLWGVDAASGAVRWKTALGVAWPVPLAGATTTDALTTLGADGRPLELPAAALRAGGFVEQPLPRPITFRLPPGTSQFFEIEGLTVIVPAPDAARILVRRGSADFRAVELPAPLAAPLVRLGKDLLVPGADGRLYLVDPSTGASVAEPFIPPYDRSRPIRWRSPVTLDEDAVALADGEQTMRRFAVSRSPRPRLAVTAERKLDKPLATDPATTGRSILAVTTDGLVRSLAARDLGPQGSWPLEAPRLIGPVVVGDTGFVVDVAGNVMAFSADGRRLWASKLLGSLPVGPPLLRDRSAWFLGRDGTVERLSLADGSSQDRIKLDALPAGSMLAAGPDLVVPTGLGTVRVLGPEPKSEGNGTPPR